MLHSNPQKPSADESHHLLQSSTDYISDASADKPHTKVCDKHKPYWMPYNIKQAYPSICIHLQKQTEAEMLRAINRVRIIAKKECSSAHERITNIILFFRTDVPSIANATRKG